MHLRSITLKGFKSFPDRTRLEFAPGVSVIVGPNGSGKSNVTDAVLWCLGEQSPLAIRGQTMQDVIFAGGHGVQARSSAEVEIVLDNSDGGVDVPFSEISIMRRLDRNGEGEYRLNGAKCRMVDVLEVLSDTGLGKEMHSVISQGRVESIVTSKPKDRRLLIEEAAGLGKHRKRRRRAQLKLDRTQENLDRVLDVEREARTRLRPLKRQAEAAELHARLERQSLEARWELTRDETRARRAALEAAEAAALAARAARETAQAELAEIAARREQAEAALAAQTEQRETIARRVERARTSADRIELRLERAREAAAGIAERIERRRARLAGLQAAAAADAPDESGRQRIEALEAEVERLDVERQAELERELAGLGAERLEAAERVAGLESALAERRAALGEADRACELARQAVRAAERSAEEARRESARVGAELAAANQHLRSHASAPSGERALADDLEVEPGFELAVAAALGGRLRAAIVNDVGAGEALLTRLGSDGGSALVAGGPDAAASGAAPVADARPLGDLVRGDDASAQLARRLLADAWLVDALDAVAGDFTGIAVTTGGRAWLGAARELRQLPQGGSERVLAERNRRDALIGESEHAVQVERSAIAAVEAAAQAIAAADASRDQADRAARELAREHGEAVEAERRVTWLIEERRTAPEQGAAAVRRAQLEGELAAERRVAERAAREREERAAAIARLRASLDRDVQLVPAAERLAAALQDALEAVGARVTVLEAELLEDRRAGEGVASELRACASAEAQIQQRLAAAGEAVTSAEVRAQQARDAERETTSELEELAVALGLPPEPAPEPLAAEEAEALRSRIERLARRREQLGPVNPLAEQEYREALEHVEEMERQRSDLETAMRELRTLIRDTDRQIRETFEETFTAAAKNFEELAAHCFPGGRGRLRLVREDAGPKPVLGGAETADDRAQLEADEAAAEAEAERELGEPEDDLGVEIEITPAGKSMKRLSLLSGGEKSMTAIAFIFSVFLAKPCPFYVLDEVEAALDDLNISRFLELVRAYRDRAQFIVVTHQKRTMEAADCLYGVSMGGDGVSKVISRRLPQEDAEPEAAVA